MASPGLTMYGGAAAPSPTLIATLERFAAAVRDPALPPPDGIDPQRFALYRELAADNLESLLNRVFPVLRACVGDASWRELRTAFFRDFRAVTPYFPRMGGEFVSYLETLPCEPWWTELAGWEWLEVEVRHAPTGPRGARVNPTLRVRHLGHAVHQLRAEAPAEPARTQHWLAVYRNAEDAVRFAELTPVTARLLHKLQAAPACAEDDVLRALAEELGSTQLAEFVAAGRGMIASLESLEILSRRA